MTTNSHSLPGSRLALFLLLAAYLAVGAGFALRTPPWQAPDEPAHYNYIAQVARSGCCPVIEPGDWDQAYLDTLRARNFAPDLLDDLAGLQYEDHQPPLYYLIAAPIFTLTDGSLIALRLVSVVIGAGVVLCAYAIGRALLPERPQIALAAAAFVAFLPQHTAVLAAVSNDGLAELVVGITLYLMALYLLGRRVRSWQVGIVVGIGLLTKMNTIFLAGLVPLALAVHWRGQPERAPGVLLRDLAGFALPALALGAVWWGRNLSVYGWPDVFGLRAHDAVVADQLRTATLIAEVGMVEYLRRAWETTYRSFWGQFGWLGLPLQPGLYAALTACLIVALAGLAAGRRAPAAAASIPGRRRVWWVLALAALLAAAQYVYYNTEFVQFQGRYLYPGLIPVALWLALGLDGWRRRLFGRAGPAGRWLAPGVMALLAAFDLYLLWRVIPLLAPR